MVSLIASFYDVIVPTRRLLDEIWDLIESVSEGFPTHSFRILIGLGAALQIDPCKTISVSFCILSIFKVKFICFWLLHFQAENHQKKMDTARRILDSLDYWVG